MRNITDHAIKPFVNPKHKMVEASFSYVGACFSREAYIPCGNYESGRVHILNIIGS
ncbi:hypothetical protein [Shewanella atlantica]|uniref:hypothetical protein n=1 Tax=Shewanella atlantica TaxID=271099 RepID=UPI003734DD7E